MPKSNTGDKRRHRNFQMPLKFLPSLQIVAYATRNRQYCLRSVYLPRNPSVTQDSGAFQAVILIQGLVPWLAHREDRQLDARATPPKSAEPFMRQVFIGRSAELDRRHRAFERKLYVIRKARLRRDPHVRRSPAREYWYVASLSFKTLVYKGMLTDRSRSISIIPT